MSAKEQFSWLSMELESLKDRVRNLLQDSNWQADGEWKESVLRTILRRHLPKNIEPTRGFVTNGRESSRQIDVLLYNNDKPSLFRDGDLVLVTPDAATGVIEVKSSIPNPSKLKEALRPLASNISMIRRFGGRKAFAALFAFETKLEGYDALDDVLECLHEVAGGKRERVVDLVALGRSTFVLCWDGPSEGDEPKRRRWHAYYLPDMAPGYFVSNVIRSSTPKSVRRNMEAWFPCEPGTNPGPPRTKDLGFGVAVLEDYKPGGL